MAIVVFRPAGSRPILVPFSIFSFEHALSYEQSNGGLLGQVRLSCLGMRKPGRPFSYCNPGNFCKRLIFVLFVNSWNL